MASSNLYMFIKPLQVWHELESFFLKKNCFYIKLVIIMFIAMFDEQYWKSNNFCHTCKIKKGKTKNLNVVYLLKCINGLCNFNFNFKVTWSPSKITIPPPFPPTNNLKFLNTPLPFPGTPKLEVGCQPCFMYCEPKKVLACIKKRKGMKN